MYVGDQRCCEVIDDANGGMFHYLVAFDYQKKAPLAGAAEALKKAEGFCKTLPAQPYGEGMEGSFQPDLDAFLGALVDDMENKKRLARQMATARKTKTLFRLKADPDPMAYRYVASLNVAGVKAFLDKKYGPDAYELI